VADAKGSSSPDRRDPLRLSLLAGAILSLLLVGMAHPSVAAPPLGPPGWVPHLPDLPLRGWGVVAVQTLGYLLGAAALILAVRRPSRLGIPWPAWLLVGGLVLLTVPFGTADHTNYAAYGHILAEGGDPWLTSPKDFGNDAVTALVQPPWQETPNVYGPVATAVLGAAAHLGGDSARQIVWLWQVVLVVAWLAVRWLLVRLTGRVEAVDTWWTGNVLVLGAGVFGAHVDLLATAGIVAALAVAVRMPSVLGAGLAGVLAGLAASTKITAGVIALALALAWLRSDPVRRIGALAVGALAVVVPLHLWAGPHVFDQVARQSGGVSYASPWRAVYTALDLVLAEPTARSVASRASALLCIVLAVVVWRRLVQKGDSWSGWSRYLRATPSGVPLPVSILLALTAAYAIGAAYVLPWYALPMWATVVAWVGLGGADPRLLVALVLQGTVVALGYVPGRILIPETMETITLAWRMVAVPLATVALWVWLLRSGVLTRARERRAPARG
jgi:hypothetical protein